MDEKKFNNFSPIMDEIKDESENESFRNNKIFTCYGSKRGISHRHHSHRKRRRIIIISAVLLSIPLVLIAAAMILFFHYYNLMDIRSITQTNVSYSHVQVSFTDAEHAEVPEGDVELPEGAVYSEKNVTNILLIGTDERTENFSAKSRADSMMILSINKKTNDIKLISLERGMLVQIPGRKPDILTHTFRYGGSELLIQTVETHFKIKIDNYVRINFSMFKKMINELGGVDIVLSQREADSLNEARHYQPVKAGSNHLDGNTALGYSRLRDIDSDWRRIERQRKVIASIKTKMKGKSLFELSNVAEKCLPYVQTDLSSGEFASLLLKMPDLANGGFEDMTIPAQGTYQGLGHVDLSANSRILMKFIYGK